MPGAPIRIIQISDTHVLANREGELLGVKTQESFEAVSHLIKQEEKDFQFIIHTGDISQDISTESYQRVADNLNQFHVPVYCVPGNHDEPSVMKHVYPQGNTCYENLLLVKNWQIILLNTQKHRSVAGYLEQSELEHLENCLKKNSNHHTAVMFHHHPMPMGSEWLDNLGLKNAAEFWQIILRYPQVNSVFFGHVHQEFSQLFHGIKCFAAPSTCIQFKPKHDEFALDNIPPGYRWIELYDDGSIKTGVNRTTNYVGKFEKDAKGY